jgi:hypothetical protein
MVPDLSDRLNRRLWLLLVIVGGALCIIGWFRAIG